MMNLLILLVFDMSINVISLPQLLSWEPLFLG